eukprot:g1300.t1
MVAESVPTSFQLLGDSSPPAQLQLYGQQQAGSSEQDIADYDVSFDDLDDVLDEHLRNTKLQAPHPISGNSKASSSTSSAAPTTSDNKDNVDIHASYASVSSELAAAEADMLAAFLENRQDFNALDREILDCDASLQQISSILSKFHDELLQVSDEIKTLQSESLSMTCVLRNKRQANKRLSGYVNGRILSQELARNICESDMEAMDGGSVVYAKYLQELVEKLESGQGMGDRADVAGSSTTAQLHPGPESELAQLKRKAVQRVHAFMLDKVHALKKPRTNLQILQQNVLLHFRYFNHFLDRFAPPEAGSAVKQAYVATMGRVYSQQFKTYLLSLSKLSLDWCPTRADVIGQNPDAVVADVGEMLASSALGFASNLLKTAGLSTSSTSSGAGPSSSSVGGAAHSSVLAEKGNVFSLSGRYILATEDLDRDPIVAHANSQPALKNGNNNNSSIAQKYYPEALFRSHQRLLIDTASSEFHFLAEFFANASDLLFQDVFEKTLQYFRQQVADYVESCYDSVGLLQKIRISEFFKEKMGEGRGLHILDGYFDAILLQMWPRLKFILAENVESLKELRNQNLKTTHPHYVTRRYAELTASLTLLQTVSGAGGGGGKMDEAVSSSLANLKQSFIAELQDLAKRSFRGTSTTSSSSSQSQSQEKIFLINNYDLILTVFYERQLGARFDPCQFEDLLRGEVAGFIELQFQTHYPEMVAFVKRNEVAVGGAAGAAGGAAPAASTEEILKQCLTQLLLYYTRFQKCLHKLGALKGNEKLLVPNSAILTEIKTYSRGF